MELVLRLRVRNSLEHMIIDEGHWEKVRHVKWFLDEEGVVKNGLGVTYEEFVGIPKGKKNMLNNPMDKRLKFLIDSHLEYKWSEFLGRFELK